MVTEQFPESIAVASHVGHEFELDRTRVLPHLALESELEADSSPALEYAQGHLGTECASPPVMPERTMCALRVRQQCYGGS